MKRTINCPRCKSKIITEIIYGYVPAPKLLEESEEDDEYYGGCLVSDNSPKWYCSSCKNKWGKFSSR